MPDLATLELRVSGAPAAQTVSQFGAASERASVQATALEKATLRQSAAFANIQATARQTTSSFLTMEQALEAETMAARASLLANDAATASHVEAAAVVSEHSLNIGRLSRSLEGFAVRAVGANEQLGLMAASFGHAELGGLGLIYVLAGVAAGIFIWRAWTEETRKADEAIKELQKSSDDLKKSQSERRFGPGPALLAAAQIELDDLNERIAAQVKKIPANDQTVYGEYQIGQLVKLQDQRDKVTASMVVFRAATDDATKAEKARLAAEENARAVAALAVVQTNEHANASDRAAVNLAILSANQKADTEILKNSLETRREVREQIDQTTEATRRATIASITADEQERSRNALRTVAYNREQSLLTIRQQTAESLVTETFALKALTIEHQHERDVLAAGEATTAREVVARMKNADAIRDEALALNDFNRSQATATTRMANRFAAFFTPLDSNQPNNFSGLEELNKQINERAKTMLSEMRREFAKFFDDIIQHGISSFQRLFDDIRSMASRLVADLAAKGLTEKLAGYIGTAAVPSTGTAPTGASGSILGGIGAALTGLATIMLPLAVLGASTAAFMKAGGAVGSMSSGGHRDGAAVGLAALGFATGSIAAAVTGFFSVGSAAKKAAAELLAMQQKETEIAATLADWRAQITGTAADQKAAALLNIKLQYMQITAQIQQLEAGKKMEAQRNKDLAEAADLYAQALKKAGSAADSLSSSMANLVQGYKYQAAIYAASSSSTSGALGGTTTTTARGDLSVNVVIDGQVIGKAVLKNFKAKAAQQFRDTTRWADIQ